MAVATAVPAGTWTADKIHSTIGFEVEHMVSTFRGRFEDYDAQLVDGKLVGTVAVPSVKVYDENLEAHLQSPDFFDAQLHPELRFESRALLVDDDGSVTLEGDLTIKGITKPVTASGRYVHVEADMGGGRAHRPRARSHPRPARVRPEVERAASEGRLRPRQRRHAHGCARARSGRGLAMTVLGISGSLREGSYNAQLLRAAADLLPPGAELRIFDGLGEIPPFDEDAEQSPPPAVMAFKEAIASADAVLIATPEYNHSIPGVLKNALDWVSRPIAANPMRGKPALVIGASTGMFGAVWAQAETRKVLGALGARVLDEELPVAKAPDGLDDHELLARLADLLGDLVSSGEALTRAA